MKGSISQSDVFRRKPDDVQAWRYDETHWNPPGWLINAINAGKAYTQGGDSPYITIESPFGRMRANPGDWIVRGSYGELRVCDAAVFERTYELASKAREANDAVPDGNASRVAALIEQAALRAGMQCLLNVGTGTYFRSDDIEGVTQDHLAAFAREFFQAAFVMPKSGD